MPNTAGIASDPAGAGAGEPAHEHEHDDGDVPVSSAPTAVSNTIFASIYYFINDDLTPTDRQELKNILDAGGATPASAPVAPTANSTTTTATATAPATTTAADTADTADTGPGSGELPPGARFDPSRTTHVIAASIDFPEYDACDDPQADDLHAPTGKRPCVVSSQWVRRSWSLGSLQPERAFSADPGLFFSGIVISCARLPKRDTELIAAAVISCGGAYREKLTREVTHLITNNRQGPKFAKLNAIFDAQEQQLANAAVTLSSAITDEALQHQQQQQQQQNNDPASSDAPPPPPPAADTRSVVADSLTQLTHLAKTQWNVKAVLPHWVDDCYRLYKLVDPKPYTWPLGDKAHIDGLEPIYITDRNVQAPFGTTALKNACNAVIPGATIGSGALHNHEAANRAFQLVAEAIASSGVLSPQPQPSGDDAPSLSAKAAAAQVTGSLGVSPPPAITTASEAIAQLALHAPENRGWPTFEEIAPAIKDSERLVVPVDEQGHEIQSGGNGVHPGPGRRARASAGASTSMSTSTSGKPGPTLSTHADVLRGRSVLFGADVMMANPDRVYAFRTRIQAAGGTFVEPPEKEGEVSVKVAKADIVVAKYRESKECLQALKQGKMCGTPQWLAFVLSTGRITNPRNNLIHFPVPKDPIPAFTKYTITLTNYTGESRTLLRHLITSMGGKFTPEMTSANTHCIAASEEGEKVKRAKEWGIPVLNHIWLEACYTRWTALDVLQPRFNEYGPAIKYGKQVLVDARLENGVLEPWLQRAFEGEEERGERERVEEEVVGKRVAAEEEARAAALGKSVEGVAEEEEVEVGQKEEEDVPAPAKGGRSAPARNGSAAAKAKESATKSKSSNSNLLVDASIMMEDDQQLAGDDSMLSTRSGRDRKMTKKAAAADGTESSRAAAPPAPKSGPKSKTAGGSNGAQAEESDEDEMDVDAAVGGTTRRATAAAASTTTAGAAAAIDAPPPSSSAAPSPNKGKGPSVKRGSGAGPASKVPERKSLAAEPVSVGAAGRAAVHAGLKRARGGGGEVEEMSEDSLDEDGPRVRQSQRQKTSPENKFKPITPPRKAARTSSGTYMKDFTSRKSSFSSDAIFYATTGVNISDSDAKLLKTLGAVRTEDMFKATHLVAAGLSRTEKMLCAIARGNVMIVDQAWLQMSIRKKALQEEANYPIQDPKNERKYKVKLEDALERSRAKPGKLLRKHEFYMTRNVKPHSDVLRKVIIAAGGSAPTALPNVQKLEEDRAHVHLISCEEDKALWVDFKREREPVRVYEAELIIAGVLKQQMDWDQHRLV
ncbi:unnamed protein product [Tilletia controversa]|uniref:BRCT domain-containing protein n=1 Tax=Tilletia controversa TaxID=13291 RepID=A0A8X7SUV1_9BASI|nr:hypothetical protein CF328_g7067 [Tilletia controversa]KAE8243062.1 hypothetical protein A4X06_0g6578 [Tilletia controversa]CAD6897913.1 unnamed protein product [Tilletia controversa]CAD6969595.1 unnamed protein product [Tilletia controversa]